MIDARDRRPSFHPLADLDEAGRSAAIDVARSGCIRVVGRLHVLERGNEFRVLEAAHDDAEAARTIGSVPAVVVEAREADAVGDAVSREGPDGQPSLRALELVHFGLPAAFAVVDARLDVDEFPN